SHEKCRLSSLEKRYPRVKYHPFEECEYATEKDEMTLRDATGEYLVDEKFPRRTVNISFAGEKFRKELISSAPLLYKILKAAKVMTQALAPEGLMGMYNLLLKACDDQIVKILNIMKDKSNLPILIHCKYGKDSTGVTIAILLSLCGVDDETIVQDYVMSQGHLTPVYPSMVKDMEKIGLPKGFAAAPPENTRPTRKSNGH
ncbi:12456_t:CDS:2, partial [Acaulospora colombiana]